MAEYRRTSRRPLALTLFSLTFHHLHEAFILPSEPEDCIVPIHLHPPLPYVFAVGGSRTATYMAGPNPSQRWKNTPESGKGSISNAKSDQRMHAFQSLARLSTRSLGACCMQRPSKRTPSASRCR